MTFMSAIGMPNDMYRKPHKTMWNYFCRNLNDELEIDKDESFFCGKNAGRPKRGR